jgi:DNA-binding MarR family transcriptional regulator
MTVNTRSRSEAEPLSKERLRLWLKLLKASGMIEDQVRRRLSSECASTLPRFDVMSALSRFPEGLKMGQISKLLRVSNGNVTVVVDRLTREGLALRVAVPGDRRAHLVRLTPRGHKLFSEHATAHGSWIDEILGGLDAGDIDSLTGQLDYLTHNIEKQKQDAE